MLCPDTVMGKMSHYKILKLFWKKITKRHHYDFFYAKIVNHRCLMGLQISLKVPNMFLFPKTPPTLISDSHKIEHQVALKSKAKYQQIIYMPLIPPSFILSICCNAVFIGNTWNVIFTGNLSMPSYY